MTNIKNTRPGIFVIPDSGLRLTPGQRVEDRESTKQIEALIGA